MADDTQDSGFFDKLDSFLGKKTTTQGGLDSFFTSPGNMGLMSAAAALLKGGRASRLPITTGEALGDAGMASIQGAQAGTQMLDTKQQIDQRDLANKMALARYQAMAKEFPEFYGSLEGGGTDATKAPPGMAPTVKTDDGRIVDNTGQRIGPTGAPTLGGGQPSAAALPTSQTTPATDPQKEMVRKAMRAEMLFPGAGKEIMATAMKPTETDIYLARADEAARAGNPQLENFWRTAAKVKAQGQPVAGRPGAPLYDANGNVLGYAPPTPASGSTYVSDPTNPTGVRAAIIPGAQDALAADAQIKGDADALKSMQSEWFKKVQESGIESAGPFPRALPGGASRSAASSQPPAQPSAPSGRPTVAASGRALPPVTDQAPIEAGSAYLKEAMPTWAKTEAEWSKFLQPAQSAEVRFKAIADALKSIEGGSWTNEKADINAKLKAVGLPQIFDADPAKAQIVLKNNANATLDTLKSATSRFTQMEFDRLSKSMANANLQPEAALDILSESLGQTRYGTALAQDWADAKRLGWRNPVDFERAWTKQHPMQGFVDKAKEEIGPLRGMTAGEGGNPLPAGVPEGSTMIGTVKTGPLQGKPVYKLPDGSQKVLQ